MAEAYFDALAKKDFDAIPYDDHVTLRAPLAPGQDGEPRINIVGSGAYKRVDALTDEDISRPIAQDPDSFEPDPTWRQRATVLRPGHSGFGT